MCKCVLYFCHRVTTQLQLTNISYHIIMNKTDFSRLFIRQRKIRHLTWYVKLLDAKNTWNVIFKPQLYLANVNLTWNTEVSGKSKEIWALRMSDSITCRSPIPNFIQNEQKLWYAFDRNSYIFKVKCVFHCESFSKACSFSVHICGYLRCLISYNRRRGKVLLTALVNVWP